MVVCVCVCGDGGGGSNIPGLVLQMMSVVLCVPLPDAGRAHHHGDPRAEGPRVLAVLPGPARCSGVCNSAKSDAKK